MSANVSSLRGLAKAEASRASREIEMASRMCPEKARAYKVTERLFNELEEELVYRYVDHDQVDFIFSTVKQLLDRKPLTPITDENADWLPQATDPTVFISNRYPSLSKRKVQDKDGIWTEVYSDVDRVCAIDIHDKSASPTYFPLAIDIADETCPITLPYMPGKQLEVWYEDFLTDEENGDFDTVRFFLIYESGKYDPIATVNRYFKCDKHDSSFVEISVEEYSKRKEKKIK